MTNGIPARRDFLHDIRRGFGDGPQKYSPLPDISPPVSDTPRGNYPDPYHVLGTSAAPFVAGEMPPNLSDFWDTSKLPGGQQDPYGKPGFSKLGMLGQGLGTLLGMHLAAKQSRPFAAGSAHGNMANIAMQGLQGLFAQQEAKQRRIITGPDGEPIYESGGRPPGAQGLEYKKTASYSQQINEIKLGIFNKVVANKELTDGEQRFLDLNKGWFEQMMGIMDDSGRLKEILEGDEGANDGAGYNADENLDRYDLE